MNLNHNPSVEQLRDLLRGADDRSGGHLLWVRRDGEVMLTPLYDKGRPPKFVVLPEMQMCCEPFYCGNGYVGPEAAQDGRWFRKLHKVLQDGWGRAKGQAETVHLDRW